MINKIQLVKNLNEIRANIKTVDSYQNDPEQKEYVIGLIKRGTCFVVVNNNGEYRFYPSRFIGYTANTKELHSNNFEKDGRVTNKAISSIIRKKPSVSEELDKEYCRFCQKLGITPNLKGSFGVKRKFWLV